MVGGATVEGGGMSALQVPAFLTFTISILVFFVGSGLNRSFAVLSRWNIPEAIANAGIITFMVR
ncbi:Na+/glutamate symporter [Sinorhizobium fredii]|jgi:glutamate:Na+ symporter, ESS family